MILEAGGNWALLGHSERRQHFAESDRDVGRRAQGVLALGLNAMVCIGETRAEREAGRTREVLTTQIQDALAPEMARAAFTAGFTDRRLVPPQVSA